VYVTEFGILSIPSTGSRFASELLELPFHHIDGGVQWHGFVKGRKIICPMRHPISVIKSWWVLRGQVHDLWDCYDSLLGFEKQVDFWLPVDSPRRDECLQKISAAMGRRFKTDWGKVGASGQVGFLEEGDREKAAPYIDLYKRVT
jgi:hypothetical protein